MWKPWNGTCVFFRICVIRSVSPKASFQRSFRVESRCPVANCLDFWDSCCWFLKHNVEVKRPLRIGLCLCHSMQREIGSCSARFQCGQREPERIEKPCSYDNICYDYLHCSLSAICATSFSFGTLTKYANYGSTNRRRRGRRRRRCFVAFFGLW